MRSSRLRASSSSSAMSMVPRGPLFSILFSIANTLSLLRFMRASRVKRKGLRNLHHGAVQLRKYLEGGTLFSARFRGFVKRLLMALVASQMIPLPRWRTQRAPENGVDGMELAVEIKCAGQRRGVEVLRDARIAGYALLEAALR